MRPNFICEWNLSALWLLPAIFANYLNYLVRVVLAHHFWALTTFAVCFSVLGSLGSVFITYVDCISGKFICLNVLTSLSLLLLAVYGYARNFYCKSIPFSPSCNIYCESWLGIGCPVIEISSRRCFPGYLCDDRSRNSFWNAAINVCTFKQWATDKKNSVE
jgi:hypothetical protein